MSAAYGENLSFKNNTSDKARLVANCLASKNGDILLGYSIFNVVEGLRSVFGDLRDGMVLMPMQLKAYPFVVFSLNDLKQDAKIANTRICWIQMDAASKSPPSSMEGNKYRPLYTQPGEVFIMFVEKMDLELNVERIDFPQFKIEPYTTLRASKPVCRPLDLFKKFGINDIINESNYFRLKYSVGAIPSGISIKGANEMAQGVLKQPFKGPFELVGNNQTGMSFDFLDDLRKLSSELETLKLKTGDAALVELDKLSTGMSTDFGRQVVNQLIILTADKNHPLEDDTKNKR